MIRAATALLATVSLGACVGSPAKPVANAPLELAMALAPLEQPRVAGRGRIESALARLPQEAGEVGHVGSQRYADGLRQTIAYGRGVPGLPSNAIDARVRIRAANGSIESIEMEKPSEQAIRSELARQFPRMPMRIVTQPRRNTYGVYGLAVGQWSNGVRCLYAWQWIDNPPVAMAGETLDAAALRIRLCRNGATLDQLAAIADRVQLEPSGLNETPPIAAPEVFAETKPQRQVAVATVRRRAIVREVRSPVRTAASLPRLSPSRAANILSDAPDTPLDTTLPAAAFRGPAATKL